MSASVKASPIRIGSVSYRSNGVAFEVQIGCNLGIDGILTTIYQLGKFQQIVGSGYHEVNILRNSSVSQFFVDPADAALQIVLDDIQFSLIGTRSKLLQGEQLTQIIPTGEVQLLRLVQHLSQAIHKGAKTFGSKSSALAHPCPNIAEHFIGVWIGKDAAHKVPNARNGRSIVVKPVGFPIGRIGTLVIVHT